MILGAVILAVWDADSSCIGAHRTAILCALPFASVSRASIINHGLSNCKPEIRHISTAARGKPFAAALSRFYPAFCVSAASNTASMAAIISWAVVRMISKLAFSSGTSRPLLHPAMYAKL